MAGSLSGRGAGVVFAARDHYAAGEDGTYTIRADPRGSPVRGDVHARDGFVVARESLLQGELLGAAGARV